MAANKTGKDASAHIAVVLTPSSMLNMLESGFIPKPCETFIDALMRDFSQLNDSEKARFRAYIESEGTEEEKQRLAQIK